MTEGLRTAMEIRDQPIVRSRETRAQPRIAANRLAATVHRAGNVRIQMLR